jgi:hypothetical protein
VIEQAGAAGQLTRSFWSEGGGAFTGRERSWRRLGIGGHDVESSGAVGAVVKSNPGM